MEQKILPFRWDDPINLSEHEQVNLGCYYTPVRLVDTCYDLVRPYIRTRTIFLDSSAGCGSFVQKLQHHSVMATDINPQAVSFLERNYPDAVMIKQDNSLLNVCRAKYGLARRDHLIVIGNPPYNDRTSKNRKEKKKGCVGMDASLRRADMGMAFLLSYSQLQADVICVLHPLSYLIKPTNFYKLAPLWEHYRLLKGIIFSSHLFRNVGSTAFPIVAALYKRGDGMNYDDLRHKVFDLLDESNFFELQRIETIDGYIRKYPPKKKDIRPSDIGLYFYNFRDSNSLWTSANFTTKENYKAHITIDKQNFYKYAYISCYKRYFPRSYIFGNLSPLVEKKLLEDSPCFRYACIVDTILNNDKLSPLRYFRRKLRADLLASRDNSSLSQRIKQIAHRDFVAPKESLAAYFKHYFAELGKRNLGGAYAHPA